jgi:hypothetical protein
VFRRSSLDVNSELEIQVQLMSSINLPTLCFAKRILRSMK